MEFIDDVGIEGSGNETQSDRSTLMATGRPDMRVGQRADLLSSSDTGL